jgi:hypothetical protein
MQVAKRTAQYHLAMADLIEAQADENADAATIQQLQDQVDNLRDQLQQPDIPVDGQDRGSGNGRGRGRRLATVAD